MKVLVLENGNLEEKEIENTLESLQEIVGGWIEIPFLSRRFADEGIDVIINEEGKLIGLEPQIAVLQRGTFELVDLVAGNCIFASHDEYGDTIGLTDKQIKVIKEELREELIIGGNIIKALFI